MRYVSFASAMTRSLPVPHVTLSAGRGSHRVLEGRVDRVIATTALEHVGAPGPRQRIGAGVAAVVVACATA